MFVIGDGVLFSMEGKSYVRGTVIDVLGNYLESKDSAEESYSA